jgi:hypothetical protein
VHGQKSRACRRLIRSWFIVQAARLCEDLARILAITLQVPKERIVPPPFFTGKCADMGKVKGPILRGLAARAPYFHNGSAATLSDVVDFYDQRFGIQFTDQQKADLVAFLSSL